MRGRCSRTRSIIQPVFLPLYSRNVDGRTTRIAIVDAYGDPTLTSDLTGFDGFTGLPSATVNFYYPNGVPHRTNSNWAVETALDVEWAHSMAPGATIDLVVGVDASLGSIYNAILYVANSLPGDAVLSMSFGLSESLYPTTGSGTIASFHQLFVTITSHGTVAVASSGDSGASSCCNIQYPASDPLVLAVGGTSLTLNSDASYSHESAWTGSSAGSSIIYPKPSWQLGKGDSMRDDVDVSYDADPNTGVMVLALGSSFEVGGTSAGAPQWAALLALASQANSIKYGTVNSQLYKSSSYHDVTTGSDGFFSASTGWDYPTGLGTPDANATVNFLGSLSLSATNINSLQGVTVTTTSLLTINMSNLTVSGTVSAVAKNSTTQATIFTKTYSTQNLKLQNQTNSFQVSFLLNIPVLPYSLSSDVTIKLVQSVATASVLLTRQLDINANGSVDIVDVSIMAVAFNSTVGTSAYNPRADFDANGVIDIIDASIAARYFGATDFL
jgi:subtilase family serine protease